MAIGGGRAPEMLVGQGVKGKKVVSKRIHNNTKSVHGAPHHLEHDYDDRVEHCAH